MGQTGFSNHAMAEDQIAGRINGNCLGQRTEGLGPADACGDILIGNNPSWKDRQQYLPASDLKIGPLDLQMKGSGFNS